MKKKSNSINFSSKTKAETLELLQKLVKQSKVEKIYIFTIEDWKKSRNIILRNIPQKFNKKIVVRSSAIGEDSVLSSEAGRYYSVLDVNTSSQNEIINAINTVISSYSKKNNYNIKNQILIQNQTLNVVTSGVIFSRTPDLGSPYFVINFEEGSSTTGVTSGIINNTVKIFRKINRKLIPQKWKRLIISVMEIEEIFHYDKLDIEFGITKSNEVIIFQVRPLTIIKEKSTRLVDNNVTKIISKSKNEFKKLNKPLHVPGSTTFFSDMTDWNPAEIIGNNPNLLDYSLYDFLIMKDSWHIGRTSLGYQNVNPYPLMKKFGNKPYVDIRGSFNSLIPNSINKKLRGKLINFYFKKLFNNPHLHDKAEFDILFTCYDFSLFDRLNELKQSGFTKYEISTIRESLLHFTMENIKEFPKISNKCTLLIKNMSENRNRIKLNLNKHPHTTKNLIESVEQLLIDCRNFGTITFSTMARLSFIGSIMLKSLQKQGYVKNSFVEHFMNSITSPLSEIQDDMNGVIDKKISKKQFLNKYGHLRPGTYNITGSRYYDKKDFFSDVEFLKINRKNVSHRKSINLDEIFLRSNLHLNTSNFLNFVKTSLVQREQLKFEFTKNLSFALELIAEIGEKLGFSRNEMACLDIKNILKRKNDSAPKIKQNWISMIKREKNKKFFSDYVILPPIIFSQNDFEIIQYHVTKPNYVTRKKLTGEIIHLKYSDKTTKDLHGKIILIENADPGYDWIFTKNPSGLITKYGGVASHMSIRCAEMGLPAAIGCGEVLFDKLLFSSKIQLDCYNKQIFILEHSIVDEDIEARKVLKSLGYIR